MQSLISRCSVLTSVVLIFEGISVVIYIVLASNSKNQLSKLSDLGLQTECARCIKCLSNECEKEKQQHCAQMQQNCLQIGWNLDMPKAAPLKCMKNRSYVDEIEKVTKQQYREQSENIIKHLHEHERNYLQEAIHVLSNPPRIIFHWFPHCWGREPSTGWTTLSDYERDSSTFTISTGPLGFCDNDTFIVVPETGLYNIYGKLTFACDEADQKQKRVSMEVAMIEHVEDNSPTILLKDETRNTCWMEGDLATLYQSGLFRLMKGNKIFIRFETPNGVKLSSNRGSPFKSNLGAYKVGLA